MQFDPNNDLNVSRETQERLTVYANELTKWNSRINLVSNTTIRDIWSRHIIDSLQVFQQAPNTSNWCDIGAGAGLPGIIISICSKETNPNLITTLIESDTRKCAFMNVMSQKLSLNTKTISNRIENIPPQNCNILSARALAPLKTLLNHADRHLHQNGTCLFPKGKTYEQEIKDAKISWNFDVEVIKSITDSQSAILKIRNIKRA